MARTIGHLPPDLTRTERERASDREQLSAERAALKSLRDIEAEVREQASGEQCGFLLDVANRMRDALRNL